MTGTTIARRLILAGTIAACAAEPALAGNPADSPEQTKAIGIDVARRIRAVRIDGGKLAIDGLLEEAAWRGAAEGTGFTQTGPHDGEAATLHELAAEYGVSAERIRQIEARALQKMRAQIPA